MLLWQKALNVLCTLSVAAQELQPQRVALMGIAMKTQSFVMM
jgi:hypothetical protein